MDDLIKIEQYFEDPNGKKDDNLSLKKQEQNIIKSKQMKIVNKDSDDTKPPEIKRIQAAGQTLIDQLEGILD